MKKKTLLAKLNKIENILWLRYIFENFISLICNPRKPRHPTPHLRILHIFGTKFTLRHAKSPLRAPISHHNACLRADTLFIKYQFYICGCMWHEKIMGSILIMDHLWLGFLQLVCWEEKQIIIIIIIIVSMYFIYIKISPHYITYLRFHYIIFLRFLA